MKRDSVPKSSNEIREVSDKKLIKLIKSIRMLSY